MLKIRALNQESSSDDDATPTIRKEAQEELALDLYNKALRLQCKQEYEESVEILQKLLNENVPQIESQGGLPKTMSTIRYSCYFNIGMIQLKTKNFSDALENLITASELDKNDVTLWYNIGKLAVKLDKFHRAADAFAQGLDCSQSHWPCLDQLITVLFVIRDTIACLEYIDKALVLDPYYVKGIVLKRSIYRSNPATEEYYRLFSGREKFVPSVDVDISEEEEREILEDVEKLCDRINEVERDLGPKPLATIPLPKPLEDFTWVALGRTLTELHKYISNNNMSHLTKIDLKKCMSIKEEIAEEVDKKEEEKVELEGVELVEPIVVKDTEEIVEKSPSDTQQCESEVEKMETEDIMERRLSQNSENDPGENATPSQTTDNEEMDQDVDDSEEGTAAMKKDTPRLGKGHKRKRDLVSDLQIWGWHSKRKASKRNKSERDFNIEDALTRIIPPHLLPNGINAEKFSPFDESVSTMDVYNLQNNKTDQKGPTHEIPESCEKYFGSDKETEAVKQFWNRNWEHCDAVDLIEEYTYAVAELWSYKWPIELIKLYITAYNMYRSHCDHPPMYNSSTKFESLRRDGLATILYAELVTYKKQLSDEEKIHCTSVSHLIQLSAWDEYWKDEYFIFASRVHWLRVHLFKQNDENTLAISALQVVQDLILESNPDDPTNELKVFLPNTTKHGVIALSVINDMLTNMELIDSLSRLESLYEAQCYTEAANVLKTTFTNTSSQTTCGKIGRPAQLGMLMHCLWFTDMVECFVWTEECLTETLAHYLKPVKESKWEMVLEKCLLIMFEIIKNETVTVVDSLSEVKKFRLVESLSILCSKQINSDNINKIPLGNVLPWILLHFILLRDEHRQQAKKKIKHKKRDDKPAMLINPEDEEIPASISILFSAHEFLGPKGWCLTNQGELLHFMLDTIIYRLDTPIFENMREKIDIHLEQAFFCLYQHPCKKNKVSRHLADHNVNPLPLTWSRAQQLYEFFCPDALPEFDSYKSISIQSDLEQLLQRIISIVPKDSDPAPLIPRVLEFLHGNAPELPKPLEFPFKVRALYYLLGDFFFKQSDFKRSYKYFLQDLCINPYRIDTWAELALGIHSQLESKLNHCEKFTSEMEFIEKAKSARICFQEALKLNDSHLTLWIEYGSFEYMVHSFCSRVLKHESDTLSMEKFEVLETEKESYLDSSRKTFEQALLLHRLDPGEMDERWLQHYMLAKISEKKQEDPNTYLQHYIMAASLLHENNCTYPEKINYSNPQHLSIEALEIHYRINASILKYLQLHEGKVIASSIGKLFKKCLDSSLIQKSKYEVKPPQEKPIEVQPIITRESDEKVVEEVKSCLEDMLKQVESSDSDVQIIDSDEERKSDVEKKVEGDTKVTEQLEVKNVEQIMETMMKETMSQQSEYPSAGDANQVDQVAKDLKAGAQNLAGDVEKIDCDDAKSEEKSSTKSEDESNIRKSTTTATEDSSSSSSSSSSSTSSDSESDDTTSTSSTSSDSSSENMSETEIINLVDRCIVGLEHCIRRLPQNYKALYRLAHLYFIYGKKKDLSKCKQLLLSEYKCKNSVLVNGLFSDRKTSNFFNGIWRIPSNEIDRAGSFSAHMGRCVTLLMQVLRDTNDHKTLLDLCLQLKRVPDPDKIYLRHCERDQLSEQALSMCIQSMRSQIKNIETATPAAAEKLMVDIFRAYQRSLKNLVQQEKVFSGMLIEVYKKLMGEKGENINCLDLAIKYCQQSRIAEKLKKQQMMQQPTFKAQVPVATPPVMPSPSTIAQPPIQPIKKPLGRPRGRPPGPKLNTPPRPRGRPANPANAQYSWQNSLYNPARFDYHKQYQEELMRQYSQTLTMNQINQTLFGATNNMLNPTSAAAAAASLMNPTSLMSTLAANQLTQSLSQMNSSMLKKITNQLTAQAQMSLMADQMKQLAALGQVSKASMGVSPTKQKVKSHTSMASTSGFKYPQADGVKKSKDNTKTSASSAGQKDIPKAHSKSKLTLDSASNLMKDRPNISITPVTQTTNTVTVKPSVSSSPTKTLQEILADKQKQQKSSAKSLEFGGDPKGFSSFQNLPQGFPPIPKSLDVIPNYLMESGVSISQVQQKPADITSKHKAISLSVIKKPEDDKKKDDDVIIIE